MIFITTKIMRTGANGTRIVMADENPMMEISEHARGKATTSRT
jgi:hypothetical protein